MRDTKKLIITLSVLAMFLGGCAEQVDSPVPEQTKRPNVILLMADDMGWGDTSHNGNPNLKTPSLDAMAGNGLVFERFYSAAPVCSPTRASVLTGRHPFREKIFFAMVGDTRTPLAPNEANLGQLMKDAGYRTGFFGKWHLGTMTTEVIDARFGGPEQPELYSPPWEHGFETVFATESRVPTWDPMLRPPGQLGADNTRHPKEVELEGTVRAWWEPLEKPEDGIPWGTHYWTGPGQIAERDLSGDDSGILIDEAVAFVEKYAGGEQPFFAIVWFHTPHLPLVAGPEDQAAYAGHEFYDRTYCGAVSAMDRAIGRLRDALAENDVADNTVLWFTSDNGPEGLLNITPGQTNGLRARKRSLYEGGIRVPGIIEWPANIRAGSATDVPAVTSDILPTLANWAGFDVPAERLLDGIDLDAIVQGEQDLRNKPIGFESQYQLAWTDDRYKLVYIPEYANNAARQTTKHGQNPVEQYDFELYDIVDDPGETTNIAAENPDIVWRMTQELSVWRESVANSIEGSQP
jgi:arylsulfatase A-like enzyme